LKGAKKVEGGFYAKSPKVEWGVLFYRCLNVYSSLGGIDFLGSGTGPDHLSPITPYYVFDYRLLLSL
jgi:hypothetical protein